MSWGNRKRKRMGRNAEARDSVSTLRSRDFGEVMNAGHFGKVVNKRCESVQSDVFLIRLSGNKASVGICQSGGSS